LEVALIVTRETSSQVTKAAHELLRAEKWDREFGHIGPQEKIWRILLELYIASEHGGGLTVKSIWLGSGLPETTALRVLKMMETGGHLLRVRNPEDYRSFIIVLSDELKQRVERYLLIAAARADG
jgi:DNA-binding MarR family transcriptional regulator